MSRNEAAERLLDWVGLVEQPAYGENSIYDELKDNLLPAALATERRLTVERVARKIEALINDPINREHSPEAVLVYQNALGLVLEASPESRIASTTDTDPLSYWPPRGVYRTGPETLDEAIEQANAEVAAADKKHADEPMPRAPHEGDYPRGRRDALEWVRDELLAADVDEEPTPEQDEAVRLRQALERHGWYVANVLDAKWVESTEWVPTVLAALATPPPVPAAPDWDYIGALISDALDYTNDGAVIAKVIKDYLAAPVPAAPQGESNG